MEATTGQPVKQDIRIILRDEDIPLTIELESPVESLFGRQIRETVLQELAKRKVTTGRVILKDHQALDFVIRARLRAAIESLRKKGSGI